jgi:hypothetical protein
MLAGKSIMSSYALRYSWPDRKRRINNRKRTESERPRAAGVGESAQLVTTFTRQFFLPGAATQQPEGEPERRFVPSDVKGATMKRTGGEINQGCRGEKRGEERYREVDESR